MDPHVTVEKPYADLAAVRTTRNCEATGEKNTWTHSGGNSLDSLDFY